MLFLLLADVAANVASAKTRRHMTVYIHAMWRMHMRARLISEIKHPYSRYNLTH